ncbi:Choline-sulfatase [Pirellulimonas nuda]|uniref:Choline-sulfatase n=1 Tax=Pirellulimonas nuda TaxID=2528009 RepID=A0A518DIY7_9BACT|nr:sulfatase [Pirellulimonas nuda]QDU91438.1 Choline-sulfatase [Pirellulimonas nuda]
MSLRTSAVLCCLATGWVAANNAACAQAPAQPASTTKPNVLFIMVDDLNDWTGALQGHPQAYTPNLDKLFRSGAAFTNAHCSAPVCNTSRHSLFTGLHPANTGWLGTTGLGTIEKSYDEVLAGRLPMPTFFRKHGYTTLAAGKIFHKGVQDFDYPYWDTTRSPKYGFVNEAHAKGKFGPGPKDGGAIRLKHGHSVSGDSLSWEALEEDAIPPKGMPDEQIAGWAVRQLRQDFDKPFFMAVGFIRPHVPYTAPKRYFDRYPLDSIELPHIPEDEFSDIPLYGKAMAYGTLPDGDHREVLDLSPTYWKELVRAYLACTTFVDHEIGRVIDALKRSPYAENTIVVLCSDHGQHLGEKRHWRKQALWEESTKVVLFLSYPGQKNTNLSNNRPVSLIDIYPTLASLCDLPDQGLDGVDLTPLTEDPNAERGKPVLTTRYYKNHSLRSQDWRYTRYRDGAEELYDHRVDPGEHHNLANQAQHAEVLQEHRKWLPKQDALPPGKDHFPRDMYDARVDQFKAEGVPSWLE